MSDFNENDNLLAKWLNGTLTPKEKKMLEQEEGDLKNLERIIQTTNQLKLPAYNKKAAFEQIKAKRKGNRTPKAKVRRLPFLRYALAASVLLLIGFFIFNPFGNRLTQHQTLVAQQKTITLSDGSEIVMNHQSKVAFNIKKWATDRTVELEGEAFFKVKEGNQFQVVTIYGTVTVLGTSFNIYSRNNAFEVSCHTGKVEVAVDQEKTQLIPNQKSIWDGNQLKTLNVTNAGSSSWQQGLSQFSGEKLERVIQELEFQFDVDIRNGNINTQETFTGAFLHQDLDTALKMVFDPMSIQYEIQGKEIYLKK